MGKIVKLEDGNSVEFLGDPNVSVKNGGALLGKGGQGAVYKVKHSTTGKVMALKVYLYPMSNAFISNLRKNIAKGAPSDAFLWPQGLTEPLGKNNDKYGYIMDIYDNKKYAPFTKVMNYKVTFPSNELQITALIDLVEAFEKLHANGYSYQDLNDGGILFDCQNGKVLICDCDNVSPSGVNIPVDNAGHFLQGKFKYMAPEVAIGMFKPDKHSDRFSLALLMFYLLAHAHPYDGIKRLSGPLTPALKEKVYGIEPVFIFHPTDTSNRPDPQEDKNALVMWPTFPDFIQKLFIKTFTSGMPSVGMERSKLEIDRQNRTSESEWHKALNQWIDCSADCPNCKHSICPTIQNNKILDLKCPTCGKKVLVERPVIVIKKKGQIVHTILLEENKNVAKSSVTNEKSNEPAFTVTKSKKNPRAFGIKNLLNYQWKCTQQGLSMLVNNNDVIGAYNGVHIEFDYIYSGDIYYNY